MLSIISVLVLALQATGQEVVFYATVDKNPVAMGDIFTYRITLENGKGDIESPDLKNFDIVFGPAQSSSLRIINGQQSSNLTLSYTLRPRGEGKYTIAPAKASVQGKAYTTRAIEVEVVKGSSSASQAQQQNQTGASRAQQSSGDDGLKLQIQSSKKSAYIGEAITVQYVLLSRYTSLDLGETEFPSIKGFWSEEIKIGQVNWEPTYEYINGVPFRKAILRKYVLFPQVGGKQTIESANLSARVNRNIFSMGTEVNVSSNKVTIEVQPLPVGAPEGFDGAVGEFDFSVKAERLEVDANNAIDLFVNVTGKGNLSLLDAPEVAFPEDFEVYDPEVKDRISVSLGGVSGTRTWHYLVIPRYPGEYAIPAIEFSYFDPSKEKYITKTEGPFTINVKGDESLVNETGGARAKSVVKQTKDEIRFIALDTEKLTPRKRTFYNTAGYYILFSLPFLAFVGFIALRKRRATLLADVAGIRRKGASKAVRRRLNAAENAMKNGDSKLFYVEIFTAIYGYLGDKLGMPQAQLTKTIVKDKLKEANIKDALVQEALYIIETCEMARFSPVTEQSDKVFYQRTVEFIEKLDELLK